MYIQKQIKICIWKQTLAHCLIFEVICLETYMYVRLLYANSCSKFLQTNIRQKSLIHVNFNNNFTDNLTTEYSWDIFYKTSHGDILLRMLSYLKINGKRGQILYKFPCITLQFHSKAFLNSHCLCHKHRAWLYKWLYTVGWPTSNSHLDIPKNENGHTKNGRWKFCRLRVNVWSL